MSNQIPISTLIMTLRQDIIPDGLATLTPKRVPEFINWLEAVATITGDEEMVSPPAAFGSFALVTPRMYAEFLMSRKYPTEGHMNVHIHAPKPIKKNIHTGHCPDCKRHSWFIGLFYEWYGPSITCLRCGRRWESGEWLPLDFVRGSRQKSIEAAKRAFRNTAVSEE